MLRVENLVKRYGERLAVDRVSFVVDKGQTVGLLGPNGAGKTTTLSIVTGLARADSGSVSVGEASDARTIESDPEAVKRRIGLVPQDLALYDEIGARANLELFGGLYGLSGSTLDRAIDEALALVGLADRARDRVGSFSGGMKRRLNIAGALLHDPDIILLDEPTVGVDPQSRNAIFDNLETLKARGKTIVYTTHYMEEAERLCDRIVIVDHGRVLADDTLDGLLARVAATSRISLAIDPAAGDRAEALLYTLPVVRSVVRGGERVAVDLGGDGLAGSAALALRALGDAGIDVRGVESERATLESVFLTLTGRSLRDAPQGQA